MNNEKPNPNPVNPVDPLNPVHPVNPLNPVKDRWPDINQLTHKIIGSAMAVHGTLGNGFQEVIYQRALAIELKYQGLEYQREMEMALHYRDKHIGTRRVDFFVENLVMVEIKAVEKLEDVHKAQAINYCEAYKIAHGLLINFGSRSLDFRRVYNKNLISPVSAKDFEGKKI